MWLASMAGFTLLIAAMPKRAQLIFRLIPTCVYGAGAYGRF